MRLTATIQGKDYDINLGTPIDLSLPIRFEGERLSVFGKAQAENQPYKTSGFIGDISQGGSCNCETYTITPHLQGTHTECAGHILKERVYIIDLLKNSFFPATVVSVEPVSGAKDTYSPRLKKEDLVITRESLERALVQRQDDFLGALIVRTAPNDHRKTIRDYNQTPAPFFSTEAMEYIASLGVDHLLVDFPSIDRADDDGKLTNHHIFWNIPQGKYNTENLSSRTVTELIFVPNDVKDGHYFLNLQLAALEGDAVPSRPILYPVKKI